MRSALLQSMAVAAASLAPGVALAQTAGRTFEDLQAARDRLLGQAEPVVLAFNASQAYTFDADLDEDGEVRVARTGLSAVLGVRASEQLLLGLEIGGEYSSYDFDSPAGLGPPGDPIDDALSVQLVPSLRWAIDDRWVAAFIGRARFSGDLDADAGDSFTGGGFVSLGYRFSDDLFLSLGVGATSRLEDDARIVPLVGLRWRINDRLTLASEGPGIALIATMSDEWSLKVDGRWDSREFRLADDAPAPDGVLRDERVAISVEAVWRPNRAVELAFGGGVDVYSNYEVLDDDGDELGDQDGDPAPFLGARLRISF